MEKGDNTGFTPLRRLPSLQTPQFHSPSRSPSRSPVRGTTAAEELDPLLANLSPTSTLEALHSTDVLSTGQRVRDDVLANSISNASNTERALGIRAALAAKKLKEWCAEVEEWYWPESKFEPPSAQEAARWIQESQSESLSSALAGSEKTSGFCGSLPQSIIAQLEERIDAIRDDMDLLDVEELKDHVRGAHLASQTMSPTHRSRRSGSYNHIDDFTMIITATIINTLPYISRLNSMLDVWFTRLIVLRKVPGFFDLNDEVGRAVKSAWDVVAKDVANPDFIAAALTRGAFNTIRDELGSRVAELGQRLDTILDALEDHEDRIPDSWIDEMEGAQETYENWVVAAERQVGYNEWREEKLAKEQASIRQAEKEAANKDLEGDLESRSSNSKGAQETESIPTRKTIEESRHPTPRQESAEDVARTFGGDAQISDAPPSPVEEVSAAARNLNLGVLEFDDVSTELSTTPMGTTTVDPPMVKAEDDKMLSQLTSKHQKADSITKHEDRDIGAEGYDSDVPLAKEGNGNETLTVHDTATSTEKINDDSPSLFERIDPIIPETVDTSSDDPLAEQASPTLGARPSDVPLTRSNDSGVESSLPALSQAHSRPEPLNLQAAAPAVTESEQDNWAEPSSATSSAFSGLSDAQIEDAAPVHLIKSPVEEVFPQWERRISTVNDMLSRRSSQRTERASIRTPGPNEATRTPQLSRSTSQTGEPITTSQLAMSSLSTEDVTVMPDIPVSRHSDSPLIAMAQNDERTVSTEDHMGVMNSPVPDHLSGIDTPVTTSSGTGFDMNELISVSSWSERSPSPSLRAQKTRIPAPATRQEERRRLPDRQKWEDFSPLEPLDLDETESLPPPPNEDPPDHESLTSLDSDYLDAPAPVKKAKNFDDKLSAKISTIVDNIPKLNLASKPGVLPVEPKQRSSSLQIKPIRPARAATPALTLAPVETKTAKSQKDGEGIKLYYLHQSGKDAPIKLHIRLVGERVMVRVGGGWADLEPYLRDYATHHGRRAVSESKFNINDISTPTSATSSFKYDSLTARSTTSRPTSPASNNGANLTVRKLRQSSISSSSPHTPNTQLRQWSDGTPGSQDTRASSRLSWTEEDVPLGLAGPKGKEKPMSPSKQAWVDEMVHQTKQASAEKKNAQLKDMGKAGFTRRMFMRSKGSGSGNGNGSGESSK